MPNPAAIVGHEEVPTSSVDAQAHWRPEPRIPARAISKTRKSWITSNGRKTFSS
eukprot:CAMPEP_0170634448 /NCGR_PEP_ID=MMETSP0224-20130122/36611_1 /TAXON_ID=285029 /ORGANISM="Togula jolla, Strain CCCM 725" /LENGTH=53 /DNA_ID=CAMNT_0010963717 /DNA_START=107 /DNA_END=268 /DNA_ORIENTATION=+